MTWIDKDGIIHQPRRVWYTKSETDAIYDDGGHVELRLKEQTPFQKQRAKRRGKCRGPCACTGACFDDRVRS